MSSSLQFTKKLLPDLSWELIVEVTPGGSLPLDIFITKNSGTTSPGAYQGVCSLEEYQRFQTFSGIAIPKFGNKYVKYSQAKITVSSESEVDSAIAMITSSAKSLSLAMKSGIQTTTVIEIP
jgi:hypothetical protein